MYKLKNRILIQKHYLILLKRNYINKKLKKIGLISNHEQQYYLIIHRNIIKSKISDDISDTEYFDDENQISLEDFFNI